MTETVPLAEARNRLSELASLVETTHERIVVTRNGRPTFAMIALDDLESLEETLDILRDPTALAQIRQAEAEESIPMTKAETLAWLAAQRADGAGD